MASIGLNVARDGSSDPVTVRDLGATWVRIVAMAEHDLTDYLLRCEDQGLRVLLVLARESFADGGTVSLYRERYADLVDAVQVGNESDLVSPSSWTMAPGELAALGLSVRTAWPGIPIVCAGMASGHPEWMDGMNLSWCDAVAVHPYAKDSENPDDLEDQPDFQPLIREYKRYGKPVLVTEWGWPGTGEQRAVEEVGDAVAWAAQTDEIEVFFYFCYSDSMVPPFGLLRDDGSEKPRAAAFMRAAERAIHSLWPTVKPTPGDQMTEYEAFCRAQAARRGIDPDIAVRVANSEGSLTEPARRGTFPTGSSWWAFQLHYGGPGYEHYGTVAGMGNEFTRVTGWQPGDPAAWRDAMRWALDRTKWWGWGAWYGAAHVGIGTWQGIDRTFFWEGTPADEWDYRRKAPPADRRDETIEGLRTAVAHLADVVVPKAAAATAEREAALAEAIKIREQFLGGLP